MKKTRVLIVDDSVFMRRLLADLLSQDPQIHIVGTVPDPLVARLAIKRYEPDVLILDINLPKMNGFDFLERLMRLRPMPVVIFASFGADGPTEAVRALALGAVDVLAKPCSGSSVKWQVLGEELIAKVKSAAAVHVQGPSRKVVWTRGRPAPSMCASQNRLVAIGASTGGVQALHFIMGNLPADCPPIVIAQHMPPTFTGSFAKRLDANSAIRVKEAADGDVALPGHAYVAPGDHHLLLENSKEAYVCRLIDRTERCANAPSVDHLFTSVAQAAGAAGMGIVLSGMGRDGTSGMMEMRQAGGVTVAQDRQSSVIYGMPKSARESGAAQYEAALVQIPSLIVDGSVKRKAIRATELETLGGAE